MSIQESVEVSAQDLEKRIDLCLAALAQHRCLEEIQAEAVRRHMPRSSLTLALFGYLSACWPCELRLPGPPAESPLGLFVMVPGPSGGTKSSLLKACAEMVPGHISDHLEKASPASGEGLHDAFLRQEMRPGSDGKERPVTEQFAYNMLVTYDELESLSAQAGRSSSTLWSMMRTGWSGIELRTSLSKRGQSWERPPVHSYQMSALAAGTFVDAERLLSDGSRGTSQRWLCGWHLDKTQDEARCGEEPLLLKLKRQNSIGREMDVHSKVRAVLTQNSVWKLKGDCRAVYGHGLLVKLRVAALIGWLRGEPGRVSPSSWALAHCVTELSEAAAQLVVMQGREEAQALARYRGEERGHEDIGRNKTVVAHNEAEAAKRTRELEEWLDARVDKYLELTKSGTPAPEAMNKATGGDHMQTYRRKCGNPVATRRDFKLAVETRLGGVTLDEIGGA